MQLSNDIKAKIKAEYDSWKDKLWAGKTKEERQKLGQFATPPPLTIKMLDDDVFKTLWHKDRKSAFLYVVQDAEMAEFLNTHLNEKVIDSISG